MLYFDNNATTRPLPAVAAAMDTAARTLWANPSSVHRPGQDVRHAVELARSQAARLINARPRELVMTSGGTESIELAIRGVLAARPGGVPQSIVTSAVEHAAVRDLLETLGSSVEIRLAPLLPGGVIDAAGLGGLIDESTALVSLQWANNETGAIQPVRAAGELCRERRVPLHIDGTQWVGKMPTDFGTGTAGGDAAHDDSAGAWIDLLTFSPHKFHGPKGVGALAVRRGTALGAVRPGSQELGRRGGTENVPGIVGLGAACEAAQAWLAEPAERERLAALRDRFEAAVLAAVPAAVVNRPDAIGEHDRGVRLWNTSSIGFPGIEAEALLLMLSERGVCASAGAACSSGSLEPSPVLLAMGIEPRIAHGSVRFSLSRETAEDDIDEAAAVVCRCSSALASALPTG
ncbi:MAG: cysteine desulfurase family protein [Planctomycetota bacterium]